MQNEVYRLPNDNIIGTFVVLRSRMLHQRPSYDFDCLFARSSVYRELQKMIASHD